MDNMLIVQTPKTNVLDARATPQVMVVQAGAQGPAGAQGQQGIQGPQGAQGVQGPMPDTGSTGILVQTAPSTFAARLLASLSAALTITNASGVGGNPTLALTGTALADYGIADAYTKTAADARYALVGGAYVNPAWITSLPWSKITGTPTTATGYGIVSIDNVPIGATTQSTGKFTTLFASSTIGLNDTNPLSSFNLVRIAGTHASASTTIYGQTVDISAPATATAAMALYRGVARTVASAFTLPAVNYFFADTVVLGASSAITALRGFYASNGIAGAATNTYGFYSDIASATTTWQLYMSGNAPSFFNGPVGIQDNNPLATFSMFRIGANHASANSTIYGQTTDITAQSTATVELSVQRVLGRTAAAAFTLANLNHFKAESTQLGAGSTITTVRGFYAANAIAVGTNNYGFYSDIASATGTLAFFSAGTASSFFTGPVGVGASPGSTGVTVVLNIGGTHPGTAGTLQGVNANVTVPATTTTTYYNYRSNASTAAAAFTVADLAHYAAAGTVIGAGSAATRIMGFWALSAIGNDVVGTTTYGFRSDINAAVNGTAFAFYGNGTADSSFGGGVLCRSTANGIGYATGAGGTVAQLTSKATGVTLSKNCGQITMNAAALAAAARVSFVVTNTLVAATDIIDVQVVSGGTANAYSAMVTACAAGSFTITVKNETAGSLSEAPIIGFTITKGVTA